MTGRILRLVAGAIAIAGMVDPVMTRNVHRTPPLTIAVMAAAAAGDPVAEPGRQALVAIAERLRSRAATAFDTSIRVHDPRTTAAACPAAGGCVIVSDGAVPARVTSGAGVVGAIQGDRSELVQLRITGIEASAAHVNASAGLVVHVEARGARGVSRIEARDGTAMVGEASYEWPSGTTTSELSAAIPIEWIPIGTGLRGLRVAVSPLEGERLLWDNDADVAVEVRADTVPVLIYEPAATWTGTFVRRALEADARFSVHGRTRVAPGIAVARASLGPLSVEALQPMQLAVVTAIDRLTDPEVTLLERFARVRGGTVVLLPGQRITGPAARLLPGGGAERHEREPQAVGPLRASELLTFDDAPGVRILESAATRPVIVSRPIGRGRVIVSGALDAWRHRDSGAGFQRFWTALAADAAAAAGPAVDVRLGDSVLSPGAATDVTAELRSMEPVASTTRARATLECERGSTPVRLWPGARPGVFTGRIEAVGAGECEVRVTIEDASGRARLVVASDARPVAVESTTLSGAVAAHGGVVVSPGDEAALVERAHAVLPLETRARETRPMRSPWWIVPFGLCLGTEWFLRRRRGDA